MHNGFFELGDIVIYPPSEDAGKSGVPHVVIASFARNMIVTVAMPRVSDHPFLEKEGPLYFYRKNIAPPYGYVADAVDAKLSEEGRGHAPTVRPSFIPIHAVQGTGETSPYVRAFTEGARQLCALGGFCFWGQRAWAVCGHIFGCKEGKPEVTIILEAASGGKVREVSLGQMKRHRVGLPLLPEARL